MTAPEVIFHMLSARPLVENPFRKEFLSDTGDVEGVRRADFGGRSVRA